MEAKKSSVRKSVSFIVSMLLHGSAIAVIAIGPTLIPGENGLGIDGRKADQVEFTIAGNANTFAAQQDSAVAEQATDAAILPVQAVITTQAVAPIPAQPVAQVATAPTPKQTAPAAVVVAKKTVAPVTSTSLPEKSQASEIDPQPIIEAANTEMPVDQAVIETVETAKAEETVSEAEQLVSQDVTAPVQEQVVAQEIPQETQDPLPAPVLEQSAQEVAQPSEQAPSAAALTATAETTAATTETTNVASAAASAAPASAGASAAPAIIEVQQTFAGLKQLPGNQPPSYTREMRLQQLQGKGQLVYFVTKEGRVTNLKLTRSTGTPALDTAAVSAFSKYKFVGGQEGYTVHDFEFSLKGPAVSDASRLRTTMQK